LPATLVATLKLRLRAFTRTQKPQSCPSRRMRPSATVLRRSKDALIITIGIKLQGLNEDKTLQQCDVLTGLVLTISTAPFDARQALSQYRPSVR
jgi:hypothetical protein